jgi:ParB family chromosome partitioning protein
MSNTTPEQQSSTLAGLGALVEFDPRALEIDPRNARKQNPKPDAALIASVERIGVQEPITVRPLGDDRYGVIKGQRRLLAAQAAAKKAAAKGKPVRPIPAFVRADLTEDDAEALLLSLVENTQRTRMTDRDTINGAAQLEIIGTSEAGRRRAAAVLGMKRDALKSAKKAAELTPEGLQSGARYGFDLMELADLQEVESLSWAAGRLASAKRRDADDPKNRRGNWQHAMSTLRQELAEERKREAAEKALTEAGVKVLSRYRKQDDTDQRLSDLTTGLGDDITPEAHAEKCAGHAARIDDEAEPVWHCADPARYGHKIKGELDDAQAKEAARADRRRVIEGNRAARAAREVRKEFIVQLCGRKSLSDAAWQFVLMAIMNQTQPYRRLINKNGKSAAAAQADVARFTRAADPTGKDEPFTELIQRTGKAKRPQLLLAHVAAAYEAEMTDNVWERPHGSPHEWLTFLAAEGYPLSDHESAMVAKAEGRTEEADTQSNDEQPSGELAEDAESDTADGPAEEAAPEEEAEKPSGSATEAEQTPDETTRDESNPAGNAVADAAAQDSAQQE